MTIKIKKDISEDPCEIDLLWDHNHPLHSLHAVSFKDISKETEEKCKELFAHGLSPGKLYFFAFLAQDT